VSWALPVAVVGAIYLVREVKAGAEEGADYVEDKVNEGIDRVTQAGTDALNTVAASGEFYGEAYYSALAEQGRREAAAIAIADAERIEASRAAVGTSNYGCVSGSLGGFCGKWYVTEREAFEKPPDSCSVLFAGPHGSNTTRSFTGPYCRSARSLGLIGARGTVSAL